MATFGPVAFILPWMLTALVALPIIWWLLRVMPPTPKQITFPPIRILMSLARREETPARTPWWLLALRLFLAALVIVALAHPLLNPGAQLTRSAPIQYGNHESNEHTRLRCYIVFLCFSNCTMAIRMQS